jgi:hypothetical protein
VSVETASLLELKVLRYELGCLRAEIRAKGATPWPDLLTTTEAVLYVRHAHRLPRFAARTLYKWLAVGRLRNIAKPRRWDREDIDRCLGGVPISAETRGARRQMPGPPAKGESATPAAFPTTNSQPPELKRDRAGAADSAGVAHPRNAAPGPPARQKAR